jgi:uncharacterized repeat protein (TIGR01451 family)
VQNARANRTALSSPFLLLQAAPPPVQTFAANCSTPKTVWTLGEDVCVTATVPANLSGVPHLVQLVNPAGFIIGSLDMTTSTQTVTFTLPSATDFTVGNRTFDNRGTWRVTLTDTIDANVSALAFITVRDPQATVANLQVNKLIINSSQATAGTNIESVVRVFNAGPDTATNVTFTDVPPPNTTFQSLVQTAGPTFTCTTPAVNTAGSSVCTAAALAKDEAADFLVTYLVNANIANAAELTTSASVESDTTETEANDNNTDESLTSNNPTPPSCTLACPANITVDNDPGFAGANVAYPDPVASSGCGALTTSHPKDPQTGAAFFPIGSTTVTQTGADGSSCSFVVTVLDKRAVSITLNGAAVMTVDCSASFTDPGATATDGTNSVPVTVVVTVPSGQVDGNGDSIPTVVPAVNTGVPGDYTITYTATKDATTATATRVVHVVSNTPPVITLANTAGFTPQTVQVTDTDDNGNPIVVTETILVKTIECHSSFTAPTATAVSGCGNAPVPVTTSGAVDANTPGTYEVIYSAVDNGGNDSETRIRVTVVDTTAPVITLNGNNPLTVECHTAFTDPGASAADGCEGPVAVSASGSVNPNVVGTYTITYTATDSGGRTTTATRTVNVVDTTAPTVTLSGPASVTVECHTSYTDAGASASDSCDSTTPVTSTSNVNVNVPGTYQVTYSAKDDSNNTGTATRTVTVVDTIAPVITTNGQTPSMWPANHKYKAFAVTDFVTSVSDSCNTSLGVSSVVVEKVTSDEIENGNGDGNTTQDIVIGADCKSFQLRAERDGGGNGRVYTITFKVKDASGNIGRVTARVVVPHNPGQTPVDSGVNYTVNGTCP